MKILKYKVKDGEHFIKYLNDKSDEIELKSKDEPLPELLESLNLLIPFVRDICEIPDENGISVSGVSISRNLDTQGYEVRGAVVIAKKELLNSTGVINIISPHRIENFYAEHGDEGQLMPDDMIDCLDVIECHVKDFLIGNRAQQELFSVEENAA